MRLARPSLLVDLNRVAGLDGVSTRRTAPLRVGATVRQSRLPDLPLARARRCRTSATSRPGTAARSAARSRTPTRAPSCRSASSRSGARSSSSRAPGRRAIDAADFFTGTFETALRAGRARRRDGLAGARRAGARSRSWRCATATSRSRCARVVATGRRPARRARVGGRPAARARVPGRPDEAAEAAAAAADPVETIHATAEYRRHATRVLVRRAVREGARRDRRSPCA